MRFTLCSFGDELNSRSPRQGDDGDISEGGQEWTRLGYAAAGSTSTSRRFRARQPPRYWLTAGVRTLARAQSHRRKAARRDLAILVRYRPGRRSTIESGPGQSAGLDRRSRPASARRLRRRRRRRHPRLPASRRRRRPGCSRRSSVAGRFGWRAAPRTRASGLGGRLGGSEKGQEISFLPANSLRILTGNFLRPCRELNRAIREVSAVIRESRFRPLFGIRPW